MDDKPSHETKILFIIMNIPSGIGWANVEFVDDDGYYHRIDLGLTYNMLDYKEIFNICNKKLETSRTNKLFNDSYQKVLKAYELACEIHDFTFRKCGGGCDGMDQYLYLVKDNQLFLLACEMTIMGLIRSEKIVKILILLTESSIYTCSFSFVLMKKDFNFKDFYRRAFSQEIEKDDLEKMEMENDEKEEIDIKKKRKRCIIC